MIDLKFIPNTADTDEGLGDAGIETFRDAPFASVARECGQNSADAYKVHPVRISFDVFEVDSNLIPSFDKFRHAINCCLDKAKRNKSEKEIEFFNRAKESVYHDVIKMLRISDSNTKGLIGPCVQGTPFHSLLKGKGVSIKDDPTAGGSFGIGKNAAFAVSDIQTVFYSTKYIEESSGQEKFLCQGKTILVSHDDGDNKLLATGYWGLEDFMPAVSVSDLPEWLQRDEIGTSIYSICFREEDNWVERLAAPLIQNFFCAIQRNEMEFSINDSIYINSQNLYTLMDYPSITTAAEENGYLEDFIFSRDLYRCLTAVETKEVFININPIGNVSVKLLVQEGLPKRVCIVRNGMVVTDNLNNFGEKFQRFPMYKDFVALVEPLDPRGISIFRSLENPKHDGFSAERIPDSMQRKIISAVMKKLGKAIRDSIKEFSLIKPADSVSIGELSEFFPEEVDPERVQDPGVREENPEKLKYKPKKIKPRNTGLEGVGGSGVEGGAGSNTGTGGSSGGAGRASGGGRGGTGLSGGSRSVSLQGVRNIITDNTGAERTIFLTPSLVGIGIISFFAEGIAGLDKLQVVSTSKGKIKNGEILLDLHNDVREIIDVTFDEPYDGPLEIVARQSGGVSDEA